MNSVLQIALVILLTIAGSLLLTEARYHGEDSTATKHRHRHHRQEFHHRSTMLKHSMTPEPEDNDESYQTYDEFDGKRQHPKKRLPDDEDDDDHEDDDDYDYESLDYPEKTPPNHHRRYQTDEFTADRRNQRFVGARGHRTRPDTRLYHTNDYPSRTRDHVSTAVPNDTKDDYEDYEYVKPLSRGHYRHHSHHPHHHQRHYPRNNEIYSLRWRNSWIDGGKADWDKSKRLSRRKHRHRERNDDMLGDDADDRSRVTGIFGEAERKWRSNDLRRETSSKLEDNEDIWKELGDYDDVDVDDEEFDGINDDYFEDISEEQEKPPYRTYDEIIKRLTDGGGEDDSDAGGERGNRNSEKGIEKYLMKDAFGNVKLNATRNSKNPREVKRNHGGVKSLESPYLGRKSLEEADAGEKDNVRQVTMTVGLGNAIRKLSFQNHTECECKSRINDTVGPEGLPLRDHQGNSPPQNIRVSPQKKPCRCPSEFTPKMTNSGECQCKCFENAEKCIRARRGKENFSINDRQCIHAQKCALPICEFGDYIVSQGKCPKKKDKIESIANYPSNNYQYKQRS
ncbi:sarcoplasmic reticulum histidine-rich calcium-binding protein-like isoform X2 [Diachasmimorpha longicaudata]|uniref:sarcoplasmic reticulum histidine-rich calcium-binding protein-like isoform X2 n=1 Tax=Diachasmimorpha longicaudata TaxID=58733 RepID=UPI0030B8B91F